VGFSPTWILGLFLQARPPSEAKSRPNPPDHIAAPGGTRTSGRSRQAMVASSSSLQVGFSVELRTLNRVRCGGVSVSTIFHEYCGSKDIVTIFSNHDGAAGGPRPSRFLTFLWRLTRWVPSSDLIVSPLLAVRTLTFILSLSGALIVGCGCRQGGAPVGRANLLQGSVGQRITLIGVAEPRKIGAALRGDDFYVWIDGLRDWPTGYVNHTVQVVGVLEVRQDLPVFVQRPGDLPKQGMPVPEGTDIDAASRRYVVRDATWDLLR